MTTQAIIWCCTVILVAFVGAVVISLFHDAWITEKEDQS